MHSCVITLLFGFIQATQVFLQRNQLFPQLFLEMGQGNVKMSNNSHPQTKSTLARLGRFLPRDYKPKLEAIANILPRPNNACVWFVFTALVNLWVVLSSTGHRGNTHTTPPAGLEVHCPPAPVRTEEETPYMIYGMLRYRV